MKIENFFKDTFEVSKTLEYIDTSTWNASKIIGYFYEVTKLQQVQPIDRLGTLTLGHGFDVAMCKVSNIMVIGDIRNFAKTLW